MVTTRLYTTLVPRSSTSKKSPFIFILRRVPRVRRVLFIFSLTSFAVTGRLRTPYLKKIQTPSTTASFFFAALKSNSTLCPDVQLARTLAYRLLDEIIVDSRGRRPSCGCQYSLYCSVCRVSAWGEERIRRSGRRYQCFCGPRCFGKERTSNECDYPLSSIFQSTQVQEHCGSKRTQLFESLQLRILDSDFFRHCSCHDCTHLHSK
ncbi:hypothetical protein L208DRAFT_775957 [Tricholoma matsutake]|nr:hypothetical protein L208DRAFT_775957 [Tricholoma matsutake 945]